MAGSNKMIRGLLVATSAIALALGATAMATAQDRPAVPNSASALALPANPTVFGPPMPSVVKATAIINGEVITQTDVDQRVALMAIANGAAIPAEELERLRVQVLRNLIDETLQIQAARDAEITITPADLDKTIERVASNVKQTPDEMAAYLAARGSSIRSIRRQIEGETAWARLQRAKIESQVSVGDDEVKAIIDKLTASKGTLEFRVGEIFLSATPDSREQALVNANKILEQLKGGAPFAGYARQFSEASTAAVGGDLGWVRPEQLPDPLARAVTSMRVGEVSAPIPVPGGLSILAVIDQRKVLTADPRNAVLTLKQVSIGFPKGTTEKQAAPVLNDFARAARNVGGCGGADALAAEFKGEIIQSDQVRLRELPPALQQMMLPMQVGQATQPFGSIDEGVRVLVMCGRDEAADDNAPTYDQVYAQLNEERVNLRARRYLRDLRRDAVIDFR